MSEEGIQEVADTARQLRHSDIAKAVEMLGEHGEEIASEDGVEIGEDVTLPFYEEDRELAFILGIAAGAEIQEAYGDDEEDESRESEDTQAASSVSDSAEQSREVETVQG